MAFTGGCLCGAVRYRGDNPVSGGHCHCNDCRKTSGTAHGSHMLVPEAAFEITGEVRFFDKPADSGNVISRGFCPTCGSPVYSRNSGYAGIVFVRASSLDDPEVFRPAMVVYTKRAPSWDQTDPALLRFEAMPPTEQVAEVMASV